MTSSLDAAPVPPPASPEEPRKNSFQRIAGVLFAPAETFQDIARRPDIVVPLLLLLVIGFGATMMIMPRLDFASAYREAFESRGNMSQEDMDRAVRVGTAFAKGLMYASPVVSLIVYSALAGIFLIAFRLFGGEGTYKQAFSVLLYSWMPLLIFSIISAVVIVSKGTVPAERANAMVMSSLGAFVDMKEHRVLFALLSSFDVFTIWFLALLTIGYSAISRLSRARSAAIVITLWAMSVVVKIGFAALSASRMKGGA